MRRGVARSVAAKSPVGTLNNEGRPRVARIRAPRSLARGVRTRGTHDAVAGQRCEPEARPGADSTGSRSPVVVYRSPGPGAGRRIRSHPSSWENQPGPIDSCVGMKVRSVRRREQLVAVAVRKVIVCTKGKTDAITGQR